MTPPLHVAHTLRVRRAAANTSTPVNAPVNFAAQVLVVSNQLWLYSHDSYQFPSATNIAKGQVNTEEAAPLQLRKRCKLVDDHSSSTRIPNAFLLELSLSRRLLGICSSSRGLVKQKSLKCSLLHIPWTWSSLRITMATMMIRLGSLLPISLPLSRFTLHASPDAKKFRSILLAPW